MTHHPIDAGGLRQLYRDNPLILLAEQALRAFYISTRAEAARVLPLWRHYGELSGQERAAVLARFDDDRDERGDPETGGPLPTGVTGWTPGVSR